MSKTKIFISHAQKDTDIHNYFVKLFVDGFGISSNTIFSTSKSGSLETGKLFSEKIKEQLRESEIVFLLITKAFCESPFCCAELGSAWILDKKIMPILLDKSLKDFYDRTPLQGKQYKLMDCTCIDKAVTEIYDELCKSHYIENQDTNAFDKYKKEFLEEMKDMLDSTNKVHPVNGTEPVIVTIVEARKVPQNNGNFRCFKLSRLVTLPGLEAPVPEETHWLLYDVDKFKGLELKVGDKVELWITKVDKLVSRWPDGLTNTRNVYVDKIIVRN